MKIHNFSILPAIISCLWALPMAAAQDITRGDVAALGSSSTIMTINQSGVYPLTTNYAGQILITANNVTLDMQGFTISGGTYGVRITGNNCMVKDGTITGAGVGLQIESNNNEIYGLDMISNGSGMRIFNGNNNFVHECRALQNTAAGFRLSGSQNNRLVNCIAIGNGSNNNAYGFVSQDGSGNTFENCLAENTATTGSSPLYAAGFALTGTEQKSVIIDCMALNASGALNYGMLISGTVSVPQNNMIRDNQVSGNSIGYRDDFAVSFTSGTNEWLGNLSANNTTNFNIGSRFPISAAIGTGVGQTENIDGLLTSTIGGPAERIDRTVVDQARTFNNSLTTFFQCGPTLITGATTISAAGYYALANAVNGQITVSGTSNVSLDLNGRRVRNIVVLNCSRIAVSNGYIVGTGQTEALNINGATNVRLQDLFVTGATYGLHAQGLSSNILAENCFFNSNTTHGVFVENGRGNEFNLCMANKNGTTGFVLTGTNHSLTSCFANRNAAGAGFQIAANSINNEIRSAFACANVTYGYDVAITTSNVITSCFAYTNTLGNYNPAASIQWGVTTATSATTANYSTNTQV